MIFFINTYLHTTSLGMYYVCNKLVSRRNNFFPPKGKKNCNRDTENEDNTLYERKHDTNYNIKSECKLTIFYISYMKTYCETVYQDK